MDFKALLGSIIGQHADNAADSPWGDMMVAKRKPNAPAPMSFTPAQSAIADMHTGAMESLPWATGGSVVDDTPKPDANAKSDAGGDSKGGQILGAISKGIKNMPSNDFINTQTPFQTNNPQYDMAVANAISQGGSQAELPRFKYGGQLPDGLSEVGDGGDGSGTEYAYKDGDKVTIIPKSLAPVADEYGNSVPVDQTVQQSPQQTIAPSPAQVIGNAVQNVAANAIDANSNNPNTGTNYGLNQTIKNDEPDFSEMSDDNLGWNSNQSPNGLTAKVLDTGSKPQSLDDNINTLQQRIMDTPMPHSSKWKNLGARGLQGAANFLNHRDDPIKSYDQIKYDKTTLPIRQKLAQLEAIKQGQEAGQYQAAQIRHLGAQSDAENERAKAEFARAAGERLNAQTKPFFETWKESDEFHPDTNPKDKEMYDAAKAAGILLPEKSIKNKPSDFTIAPDGTAIFVNKSAQTYTKGPQGEFAKQPDYTGDNSSIDDKNLKDQNDWNSTISDNKGKRAKIQGQIESANTSLNNLTASNNVLRDQLAHLNLQEVYGDKEKATEIQRNIDANDKKALEIHSSFPDLQGQLKGIVDPPKPIARKHVAPPNNIGTYSRDDFTARAKAKGLTGKALESAIADATTKGIIK